MSSRSPGQLQYATSSGPWGLWATGALSALAFLAMFSIQAAVSATFIMEDLEGFKTDPGRFLMDLLTSGRFQGIALVVSMPTATALIILFAKRVYEQKNRKY